MTPGVPFSGDEQGAHVGTQAVGPRDAPHCTRILPVALEVARCPRGAHPRARGFRADQALTRRPSARDSASSTARGPGKAGCLSRLRHAGRHGAGSLSPAVGHLGRTLSRHG